MKIPRNLKGSYLAKDEEIPTPSTLETILTDTDHQDSIAFEKSMITYLATVHKDNHSDYGVQF
ncbi:hypothetical protein [Crocosphaera sp. XPORK-15E]|uniref:hypothetical protein n=1 Tax=Crocosphaera sp. XPORK-15E TaxID=3110247 RepID=UPI002B2144B4|nr:hypothetical protein [Crocosphaera sp. XPORK-15E]MEA5536894.1 hypothetical protein [Crocosphaera sp. XPORK-15E]